jgi:SAM-dependent methyltransferase
MFANEVGSVMNDDSKFFTDGVAYERMMGRWSQIGGALFLDWLAAPRGLRWLDVGCGNGAFSEVLMARCPPSELHGIDPSEAQLAYAKTRDSIKSAQFHTGDAQALPFDDASFDVATMALVISFIPDPAKAVSEMARVVRPGGWVASYMWDVPGGGLPYAPIPAAVRAMGLPNPFRPPSAGVYSFPEMHALWQQAGLENIETRRIDVPVTYADFNDFWESSTLLASPVNKLVESMSPADRERLRKHLHDTLPTDVDGRISFGAFANAVKGRVHG